MTIAREEIFGPVLSIVPYDDEDDAVRIANDTTTACREACGPATPSGPSGWPAGFAPAAWKSTAAPSPGGHRSAATSSPATAASSDGWDSRSTSR